MFLAFYSWEFDPESPFPSLISSIFQKRNLTENKQIFLWLFFCWWASILMLEPLISVKWTNWASLHLECCFCYSGHIWSCTCFDPLCLNKPNCCVSLASVPFGSNLACDALCTHWPSMLGYVLVSCFMIGSQPWSHVWRLDQCWYPFPAENKSL